MNIVALLLIITALVPGFLAIGCFKCESVGGRNPLCEDPFHNNFSKAIFHANCEGGRKNRNGLFPATSCIKLSGIFDDTKETMVVRDCALDSGTLTIDTELVRMSHCGGFYFNKRYVTGCVQSCSIDACNHSGIHLMPSNLVPCMMLFMSAYFASI